MNNSKILQTWPKWPQYSDREMSAVLRVIKSNQLFAASEVKAFERDFANYIGVQFGVGVGNATQGLHLALAAAGVGVGDEVIVTPCSWISSASCVLMQNAVPVFVDIESTSLGLDPELVKAAITPFTKAIIVVHILGYPSRIDEIAKIAKDNNLILIEDASHAPGAQLNGSCIGSFGDMSVFSLHQRKAISTGDGGIICTNIEKYRDKLSKLRSFGDQELSYNYRMTEFSAALGRLGLENLDSHNIERRTAAEYLHEKLKHEEWVRVRLVTERQVGVYYAIAIEVNLPDEASTILLNDLIKLGVPMRMVFSPLNRHPHFSSNLKVARGLPWNHPLYQGSMRDVEYANLDLPVAYEFCYGRILELYTHPGITTEHLDAFAEVLVSLYQGLAGYGTRKNW